jgi:hypothetical protein
LLEKVLKREDVNYTFLLHSREEFSVMYGQQMAVRVEESPNIAFAGGPILRESLSIYKLSARKLAGPVEAAPPEKPFLLFVIGGGGDAAGCSDTEKILHIVNEAAVYFATKQQLRILFIGGPYFKYQEKVDKKYVDYIPYLTNLYEFVTQAAVVIARPGFNLTREIFDKAMAVVLLKTYQYEEASEANLKLMQSRHCTAVAQLEVKDVITKISALLDIPKEPIPKPLWQDGTTTLLQHIEGPHATEYVLNQMRQEVLKIRQSLRFMIRIDDVVEENDSLIWLLTTLAERNFRASLEIVPYLNKINESFLDRFDPEGVLFEVSQHGVTHILPEGVDGDKKEELGFDKDFPSQDIIQRIEHGRTMLQQHFSRRFHGGFSPPFDGMPHWLSSVWYELGGRYISVIWCQPRRSEIPLIRVSTDIWDWNANRLRSMSVICSDLVSNFYRRGEAGLVFHPIHFKEYETQESMVQLLDVLKECGLKSVWISELAQKQSLKIIYAKNRRYADME